MRSCHSLKRLSVAFSDQHAVADAGLLLPATLAEKLGLKALFDEHVDLGAAPGAGNVGVKAMSLIYSALAGGDCIDDADLLRSGSTQAVLGCALRALHARHLSALLQLRSRPPAGRRQPS